MIPREAFSERRFPGWLPYGRGLIALAWTLGILHTLLQTWMSDRAPDFLRSLILQPLVSLSVFLFLVSLFVYALRVSWSAALQALLPWTLIALLIFPLDALVWTFGWKFSSPFLNVPESIISILTGGLFPRPLVSLGAFCVWWGMLWVCFSTVKHLTQNRWRAWATLGAGFFVFPCFFLIPSVLAWSKLPADVSIFSAGPNTLQRAFVLLNMDGYWWKNIYDRFPLANAGEAIVSGEWFLAAAVFVALCGVGFFLWRKASAWSGNTWKIFLRLRESVLLLGPLFLGLAFAWGRGWHVRLTSVNLVAWMVLAIVIASTWVFGRARRDLHERVRDETHDPARPLVSGLIRAGDLTDFGWTCAAAAIVGAWLLGWPVMMCVVFALWTQTLEETPPMYARALFPAGVGLATLRALSWILVGWLFASEQASVRGLPFGWVVGAGLIIFMYLGDFVIPTGAIAERRDPFKGFPRLRQTSLGMTKILRITRFLPALGYAMFPILVGNSRTALVALPLALGSLVFKHPWRILVAFFSLTMLLLASGWFVPF